MFPHVPTPRQSGPETGQSGFKTEKSGLETGQSGLEAGQSGLETGQSSLETGQSGLGTGESSRGNGWSGSTTQEMAHYPIVCDGGEGRGGGRVVVGVGAGSQESSGGSVGVWHKRRRRVCLLEDSEEEEEENQRDVALSGDTADPAAAESERRGKRTTEREGGVEGGGERGGRQDIWVPSPARLASTTRGRKQKLHTLPNPPKRSRSSLGESVIDLTEDTQEIVPSSVATPPDHTPSSTAPSEPSQLPSSQETASERGEAGRRGKGGGGRGDVLCPLCQYGFPQAAIEAHAASCEGEGPQRPASPEEVGEQSVTPGHAHLLTPRFRR